MGDHEEYEILQEHVPQKCWRKLYDPVFLLNACLGLMVFVDPTTWQRAYCYGHRVFIYGLLVITCVLQNAVCFRRDGFVITLQLSNGNETVCSAEQHLIISNVALKIMVIIAYTLLIVYFTTWEPKNIQKSKEMKQEEAAIQVRYSKTVIPKKMQQFFMNLIIPIWILVSFTVRLMQAYAFGLFPHGPYNLHIRWGDTTLPTAAQLTLGSFCLAGFVLFDLVYLAVVVAYISQCEVVRKVVETCSKNILHQQRGRIGLSPQETIQNIGKIRTYMEYINGKLAWLVAVIFINFARATVTGLWSIDELVRYNHLYDYDFALASIAQAISTILWVLLLIVPLIQAARLTAACTHLKNSACDLLEKQAANWAQDDNREFQLVELYTLYLNTVSSSLTAKIFGIPIHSWAVYSAMVLSAYVLLILIETNTYTFVSPIF